MRRVWGVTLSTRVTAIVVLALVLAGCGVRDNPNATEAPSPTGVTSVTTTVAVVAETDAPTDVPVDPPAETTTTEPDDVEITEEAAADPELIEFVEMLEAELAAIEQLIADTEALLDEPLP